MNEKENVLEKLYLEAVYAVFWNEAEILFKVGEISDEIRQLLQAEKAQTFAFLTAYNPFSKQLADEENKLRQAELIRFLKTDNFIFYKGYGTNEDESWEREESLFILNIELEKALQIARRFEQHAILFGEISGKIQLIWC